MRKELKEYAEDGSIDSTPNIIKFEDRYQNIKEYHFHEFRDSYFSY